jgi:hypothetical protein
MPRTVRKFLAAAMTDQLGIKVERATATLPGETAAAIFTISGGRVLVTGIIGEVTATIQTQANATKLTANPTTGPSADICATLDITADAAGLLYGVSGTFGDALVGSGAAAPFPARPIVLDIGTLDLDCAATNTGSVKWTIWYIPLDTGAAVVAA